ncbi:hypothetical protein QE152_g33888 [Popillia japonica]|uniref:Uncharacterized protein n=1 Tax=Popillia japonica TaxID=7064 RepID=A0AAW1IVE8_POPJA
MWGGHTTTGASIHNPPYYRWIVQDTTLRMTCRSYTKDDMPQLDVLHNDITGALHNPPYYRLITLTKT